MVGVGTGVAETGAAGETPRVSILVVSYNTRQMTVDCLRSVIAETTATSYELIVVDNASSDGSAEAIAALGGGITFIPLTENIGFARANNLAARQARGDLLLLLNPDTLILDRAIDRLTAFADETPSAGIWGGRTLFGDRRLDPTSVWARMSPWSMLCRSLGLDMAWKDSPVFNPEAYGGWERDTVRPVDIVCGCFLLIRRSLWDRLGGFDRAFFMYGEEADLCLRAAALGARPMFTPTATIVHYGGASERTQAGKVEKLFRAKITLMRRHWSVPAQMFGGLTLRLWPLTRLAAARALGRSAQAAMWAEVWRNRPAWLAGYDGPSPSTIDALPQGAD